MEVRFFLSVESCTNRVRQSSSKHETPKGWSSLSEDSWDNEDNQPSHHQIEEEGELFIDFFSKNFVENSKNCCSPLEDDDAIA